MRPDFGHVSNKFMPRFNIDRVIAQGPQPASFTLHNEFVSLSAPRGANNSNVLESYYCILAPVRFPILASIQSTYVTVSHN